MRALDGNLNRVTRFRLVHPMRLASPFLAPALALALVLCAAGCEPAGAACDFRQGSKNGPERRCQEYHGFATNNGNTNACNASQATWLNAPCPRVGLVGGCLFPASVRDGSFIIDWYYAEAGRTTDTVKTQCGKDQAMFVAP